MHACVCVQSAAHLHCCCGWGRGRGSAAGEKRRLKLERREAKRAARAASRGFDLPWVNRTLAEFVARQGDMQAFGPFGKHECKAVARLAALYGCRATLQGGGKSHRRVAMVRPQ